MNLLLRPQPQTELVSLPKGASPRAPGRCTRALGVEKAEMWSIDPGLFLNFPRSSSSPCFLHFQR